MQSFFSRFKPLKSKILILPIVILSLSACDATRNQLRTDRDANLEIQDFKDALAPRLPESPDGAGPNSLNASSSSIPSLQPYITSPDQNLEPLPLVSISVNQTVPLRDILFELAKQADYDIELDPRISGSVIFTARNRPFDEVIKRLSKLAGLRYSFDDDVLRVELDTPFTKTYKIDYINFSRSNTSSITTDLSVVSGEGADTGSNFASNSTSEADFWAELETNIEQIIGSVANDLLVTRSTPAITPADPNPNVVPVAPVVNQDGTVQVQPPQASLSVSSLPSGGEEEILETGGTFTINRQAGLLTVFATQRVHDKVSEYVQRLRLETTTQVLIEAKILEVSLTDEYSSGIDWTAINLLSGEGVLQFNSDFSITNTTANNLGGNTDFFLGFLGNDIQALVEAVSGFGTVRALASPRLTVLNNQSAILNVATNRVFFDIEIEREDGEDGDPDEITIESEVRNVPEGVLVNVQPFVDLDTNTIALALRPSITRIEDEVVDPGVAVAAASAGLDGTIQSLVPELNIQEIDSLVKVRSGVPIVLGGLLEDRVETNQAGVPVLSEMPLIGGAFRNSNDTVQKTELVIIMQATIVKPDETVHDTDKDLYRRFSGDRRPFKL